MRDLCEAVTLAPLSLRSLPTGKTQACRVSVPLRSTRIGREELVSVLTSMNHPASTVGYITSARRTQPTTPAFDTMAEQVTKSIYGKEHKHVPLRESSELSDYTLTDHIINVQNQLSVDARTTFVMNSLVKHLHAFLREARPTPDEYAAAREFIRQLGTAPKILEADEVFLLGASFGIDEVLNGVRDARPEGCTRVAQEGPFYVTEGVPVLTSGSSIASPNTKGEKLFFEGTVKNLKGEPIKKALVDVWQADGDGIYDVQYGTRRDDRARILAKDDGTFTFRGVAPTAYTAFPENGPTAKILAALGRHAYRATHIHFRIEAPGYETLITQVFPSNSPVLGDDSIFAAQPSLIAPVTEDTDPASWAAKGFNDGEVNGGKVFVWKFDFVLPTPEETKEMQKKVDEVPAKKKVYEV